LIKDEENIEDIINYFAISLFGQHNVNDILWDLAKNCISKLSLEDCVIYLLDEDRNVLIQKAAYGPKNEKDFTIYRPIEIAVGTGIVGSVAKSGLPELIGDTSVDSRYIRDDAFRLSEITVPILLNGKVIGIIDCEHSEPNFFTPRHLKTLTLIASLCASKILSATNEEKIRKEQRALHEAQQKLAEFKMHALRTQINPHFIFNALNAIQSFIVTKNVDQAIRYLSLVGKFIRKVMAGSDSVLTSLADEIEILVSYLDLEKLRFGNKFHYDVSTGPGVDPSRHRIPSLLIHLFAANSFNDKFLDDEDPGILSISFQKADKSLICSIMSRSQYDSSPFDEPRQQDLWDKVHARVTFLHDFYGMNITVTRSDSNGVEISLPTSDVASNGRNIGITATN
jgi:two-component system, LytTR family, sensor kinase